MPSANAMFATAQTESGMTKRPADQPETQTYEIRLLGHLDPRWAARLAVRSLAHESDGTTILVSTALDQAALHGLLQRVRDLGLTLVSVLRAGPDLPETQPSEPRTSK
jgi:hypothetical protein